MHRISHASKRFPVFFNFFYSVPVGIFIALVLFINCFQDYNADKAANKNSWVVKLAGPGEKANYRKPFSVWKSLMVVSFLLIVAASVYAQNYFKLRVWIGVNSEEFNKSANTG